MNCSSLVKAMGAWSSSSGMAFLSMRTTGKRGSTGTSASGIEAPPHKHLHTSGVSSPPGEMCRGNRRMSLVVGHDRGLLASRQACLHRRYQILLLRQLLNAHGKPDQCVEKLAFVFFRMELDDNASFHETE